jgi:hypothetical protein
MQSPLRNDEIRKGFAAISQKTDFCLLTAARQLAAAEKKTQVALIAHLAEIARRKLHLDQGYASMFDYCLRALHLAEGEIWLRLQVSSRCGRFPELLEELAAGGLNLTSAGKICAFLREDNKTSILQNCRGKTTREVEEYLCSLKPKPSVPSSLQRCPRSTALAQPTAKLGDNELRLPGERELFPSEINEDAANTADHIPAPAAKTSRLETLGEERYYLHCTVSTGLRRKIERLAEVLGIDNPARNLPALLEQAFDIALKAKDPAHLRRAKQAAAAAAAAAKEQSQEQRSTTAPRSRHIPAAIKRAVFHRGEYRCQYAAADGARCPQHTHLCVDHIVPFAQGGTNDLSNLQLLCARHNLRKMERDFGFRWHPPRSQQSSTDSVAGAAS